MSYEVTAGKVDELQKDTRITVFHGTDASTAKIFLRKGIDATREIGRTHNQGRERGLYVTPSLKTAAQFGNYIFKFIVQGKDLYPTARWGVGVSRKSKHAQLLASEKFPKSFRPMVSFQLKEQIEPQAMFLGYVSVRSIICVYYVQPNTTNWQKLSVDDAKKLLALSNKELHFDMTDSPEQVLEKMAREHGYSGVDDIADVLTDFLRTPEMIIDTLDASNVPRKLQYRVLDYLKQRIRFKAISNTLKASGIDHVVIVA